MQEDLSLPKLRSEVLVGHVEGCPGGGHIDLPSLDLEGNVVDVRMEPAVGLAIHCLRTECGSHQEHRPARQGTGRERLVEIV